MDSQHNGQMHIKLNNGKNTIVIPERPTEELRPGIVKAGVLYTSNPYTPEEQGRKPKIRIEGVNKYPHYIKGVDSDEEVMNELEKYVELLKVDPTLPDVFDVFSEKTLVNVRATYALEWFKNNNKLPSYTANKSDEVIKETMRFWGFDGSSEANSDYNFRYATILKYLDNGGFMNAGNGITGFNQGQQGGALDVSTGWGYMHELGHNFDFNKSSLGETTNNILPLHFQKLNGTATKITEQNLWEKNILPKVALDDYSNNIYYPETDKSLLSHIAPLWQLQLYDDGFWAKFQKNFRNTEFKGGNTDEVHNEWVRVSSDILKLDLYEHFSRHGMKIDDSVKEYTSKYPKPDKKLWYINDKIYLDNGGAFDENLNYRIKSINQDGENVKLTFEMDKENIKNRLGYEIIRDGETVGFTAEDVFIDKTAKDGVNHEYKIIAYDKEITPQENAKPSILVENSEYKIGESIDLMKGVTAYDTQDGDLTYSIVIKESNFIKDSLGRFKVTYEVKDSDNNTTEKTINIDVYDEFEVVKSQYGNIDDLDKYNQLFKVQIDSISNNGRNYGSSTIDKSVDGKIESHFETGKANSGSFKNEVILTLDTLTEIDKMSYASRKGGKGFASEFEVYISESADGDDFYKSGHGKYTGSQNDVIEFNLNGVNARRVKFAFVEAIQNWASIGEIALYKEDKLSKIVENNLFIDKDKSDVTEEYNTLEKLNTLREDVKNHPAANILEQSLKKAEELIRAKFPSLEIPKDISTKMGYEIDFNKGYIAEDKEDGNITDRVTVIGADKVNYNKPGTYEVIYSVQDTDGNITTKTRNVYVVDMEDYTYLSDTEWKSVHNTYGKFEKDRSYSQNTIRLTGEDGDVVSYEKGLGTHSTATVIYDLEKLEAQYFTSFVGVDRQMYGRAGSVVFQVFLDGVNVYDSGLMISTDAQKFVEVDLSGAKELKLAMTDGGNGNGSDHGNWADAKLHYVNENSKGIDRSQLDSLIEEIQALKEDDYTTESLSSLILVKDKVMSSLSDGYNQEEVNELYEELKDAQSKLKEVVKYDGLENLVKTAKSLKNYIYTSNTWTTLLDIITQAEIMIEEKNSTSEQVNSMMKQLTDSINNLEVRADKIKLEQLVNYADTITDISVVGASKHKQTKWDNFIFARE